MRDAEAGQEGEPGRGHPGKMSPTGGRSATGWEGQGCGRSQGMAWQSGVQETRSRETGWEPMREQEKIALWVSVCSQDSGLDFRGQRQGLGKQEGSS